jgi:hypothetical protein
MKLFVILTALLALSACAEFPTGTKVAPGFPDGQFEASRNTNGPASQEPAPVAQLGN